MSKRRKLLRQTSTWLNVSIVGIQFPVAIVIGYWIGTKLDQLFGTKPWLMLLFLLFGIAAGFLNLYRITTEAGKEEARQARAQGLDGDESEPADERQR